MNVCCSYCRITGKSRGLPKCHYPPLIPMPKPDIDELRRKYCRITAHKSDKHKYAPPVDPNKKPHDSCRILEKRHSLESHSFIPVFDDIPMSHLDGCRITQHHARNSYNFMYPIIPREDQASLTENQLRHLQCSITHSHHVNPQYRYVCPVMDDAIHDLRARLCRSPDSGVSSSSSGSSSSSTIVPPLKYVYPVLHEDCGVILDAELEEILRSGEVEHLLLSKDGSEMVIETTHGDFLSLKTTTLTLEQVHEQIEEEKLMPGFGGGKNFVMHDESLAEGEFAIKKGQRLKKLRRHFTLDLSDLPPRSDQPPRSPLTDDDLSSISSPPPNTVLSPPPFGRTSRKSSLCKESHQNGDNEQCTQVERMEQSLGAVCDDQLGRVASELLSALTATAAVHVVTPEKMATQDGDESKAASKKKKKGPPKKKESKAGPVKHKIVNGDCEVKDSNNSTPKKSKLVSAKTAGKTKSQEEPMDQSETTDASNIKSPEPLEIPPAALTQIMAKLQTAITTNEPQGADAENAQITQQALTALVTSLVKRKQQKSSSKEGEKEAPMLTAEDIQQVIAECVVRHDRECKTSENDASSHENKGEWRFPETPSEAAMLQVETHQVLAQMVGSLARAFAVTCQSNHNSHSHVLTTTVASNTNTATLHSDLSASTDTTVGGSCSTAHDVEALDVLQRFGINLTSPATKECTSTLSTRVAQTAANMGGSMVSEGVATLSCSMNESLSTSSSSFSTGTNTITASAATSVTYVTQLLDHAQQLVSDLGEQLTMFGPQEMSQSVRGEKKQEEQRQNLACALATVQSALSRAQQHNANCSTNGGSSSSHVESTSRSDEKDTNSYPEEAVAVLLKNLVALLAPSTQLCNAAPEGRGKEQSTDSKAPLLSTPFPPLLPESSSGCLPQGLQDIVARIQDVVTQLDVAEDKSRRTSVPTAAKRSGTKAVQAMALEHSTQFSVPVIDYPTGPQRAQSGLCWLKGPDWDEIRASQQGFDFSFLEGLEEGGDDIKQDGGQQNKDGGRVSSGGDDRPTPSQLVVACPRPDHVAIPILKASCVEEEGEVPAICKLPKSDKVSADRAAVSEAAVLNKFTSQQVCVDKGVELLSANVTDLGQAGKTKALVSAQPDDLTNIDILNITGIDVVNALPLAQPTTAEGILVKGAKHEVVKQKHASFAESHVSFESSTTSQHVSFSEEISMSSRSESVLTSEFLSHTSIKQGSSLATIKGTSDEPKKTTSTHAVAVGQIQTDQGACVVTVQQVELQDGRRVVAMANVQTNEGPSAVALGQIHTSDGPKAVALGHIQTLLGTKMVALGQIRGDDGVPRLVALGQIESSAGTELLSLQTLQPEGKDSAPVMVAVQKIQSRDLATALDAKQVPGVTVRRIETSEGPQLANVCRITTADGAAKTVALGQVQTSEGSKTVALGQIQTAQGPKTVALGQVDTPEGPRTLALGQIQTSAGPRMVVLGQIQTPQGPKLVALSQIQTDEGPKMMAVGQIQTPSGPKLVALSHMQTADGVKMVAVRELHPNELPQMTGHAAEKDLPIETVQPMDVDAPLGSKSNPHPHNPHSKPNPHGLYLTIPGQTVSDSSDPKERFSLLTDLLGSPMPQESVFEAMEQADVTSKSPLVMGQFVDTDDGVRFLLGRLIPSEEGGISFELVRSETALLQATMVVPLQVVEVGGGRKLVLARLNLSGSVMQAEEPTGWQTKLLAKGPIAKESVFEEAEAEEPPPPPMGAEASASSRSRRKGGRKGRGGDSASSPAASKKSKCPFKRKGSIPSGGLLSGNIDAMFTEYTALMLGENVELPEDTLEMLTYAVCHSASKGELLLEDETFNKIMQTSSTQARSTILKRSGSTVYETDVETGSDVSMNCRRKMGHYSKNCREGFGEDGEIQNGFCECDYPEGGHCMENGGPGFEKVNGFDDQRIGYFRHRYDGDENDNDDADIGGFRIRKCKRLNFSPTMSSDSDDGLGDYDRSPLLDEFDESFLARPNFAAGRGKAAGTGCKVVMNGYGLYVPEVDCECTEEPDEWFPPPRESVVARAEIGGPIPIVPIEYRESGQEVIVQFDLPFELMRATSAGQVLKRGKKRRANFGVVVPPPGNPNNRVFDLYVAIADYIPDGSDAEAIPLWEGQIVEVLDSHSSQKWLVRTRPTKTSSSKQGWVPPSYLEKKTLSTTLRSIQEILELEADGKTDSKEREAVRKRAQAVKELVETEEEFSKDMLHVVNTYVRDLENTRVPKEIRDLREAIFMNFSKICDFHNNVLIKGVQYYANEPARLGKTFLRLERDFDMHVNYCRDEPKAQQLLTVSPAKEYFQQYSQRIGEVDKTLADHLKLPIQRINDYQLLLKELIKYSARLKEDCTDLQKALDLMLSIPQRASDLKFLNSIEGYRGNLLKLGRLLRHDWFTISDSDGKSKERYLFLFKARVLVCKVKRINEERSIFILKDIIRLPDVEIKDRTGDKCKFELVHKEPALNPRYPLTLITKTEFSKEAWLKEIREFAQDVVDYGEEEVEVEPDRAHGGSTGDELEVYEELITAPTDESVRSESITSMDAKKQKGEKGKKAEKAQKPVFTKPLRAKAFKLGDSVSLECDVLSVPPATVLWLKDNVPLSQSDRLQFITKGNQQVLSLKGAQAGDAGLYTAHAVSSAGSDTSSAHLSLLDVPKEEDERPTTPGGTILPHAPIFSIKFKDTELLEDSSVTFMVKVRALPEAEVKFFKDGKDLKVDDHIKIIAEDKETFELLISHIKPKDAGKYSCVAKNNLGEATTEANVTISSEKSFVGFKVGEEMKSQLVEGAGEEPTFTWYRDGQEFEASERFKVMFKDEEDTLALVFQHVKPEDAGMYTCVASTTSGNISCSAELTVQGGVQQLMREPAAPKITAELTDSEVNAGGSAMLEIKVTGFPKPAVTWTKDGKTIEAGGRFRVLHEDEESIALVIKNVESADSGKYKVSAKNNLGEASTSANLLVKAPPTFKKTPKDVTAMVSQEVRLEVQIEGQPVPEVTWFRDGQAIKTSDRVKAVQEKDGVFALVIKKSTSEDSGSYSCVASNTSGKISEFCKVSVSVPPNFLKEFKNTECREHETVKLEVKVDGTPPPTVSWLRDGEPLKADGKHIKIEQDDRNHCIVIDKVTRKDSAKYSCTVTNTHGSATCGGNLIVNCIPEFSAKLSDRTVKEGDEDVKLEVKLSGTPEPTLKWYIDKMEITEKANNFKLVSDGESKTLIIKKVSADCAGKITCNVKNSIGEVNVSATLNVLTVPKFTEKLSDKEVTEGDTVVYQVKVTGNPEPQVKWYKNNNEVSVDAKIKIKHESSETWSLTLDHVSGDTSGEYECRAKNSEGESVTKSKLIVNMLEQTQTQSVETEEEEVEQIEVTQDIVTFLEEAKEEMVQEAAEEETIEEKKDELVGADESEDEVVIGKKEVREEPKESTAPPLEESEKEVIEDIPEEQTAPLSDEGKELVAEKEPEETSILSLEETEEQMVEEEAVEEIVPTLVQDGREEENVTSLYEDKELEAAKEPEDALGSLMEEAKEQMAEAGPYEDIEPALEQDKDDIVEEFEQTSEDIFGGIEDAVEDITTAEASSEDKCAVEDQNKQDNQEGFEEGKSESNLVEETETEIRCESQHDTVHEIVQELVGLIETHLEDTESQETITDTVKKIENDDAMAGLDMKRKFEPGLEEDGNVLTLQLHESEVVPCEMGGAQKIESFMQMSSSVERAEYSEQNGDRMVSSEYEEKTTIIKQQVIGKTLGDDFTQSNQVAQWDIKEISQSGEIGENEGSKKSHLVKQHAVDKMKPEDETKHAVVDEGVQSQRRKGSDEQDAWWLEEDETVVTKVVEKVVAHEEKETMEEDVEVREMELGAQRQHAMENGLAETPSTAEITDKKPFDKLEIENLRPLTQAPISTTEESSILFKPQVAEVTGDVDSKALDQPPTSPLPETDIDPNQAKPTFEKGLSDSDAWIGLEAKVEVKVNGVPDPEVKWTKDGQPVATSARVKIEKDGKTHRIAIKESAVEDTGLYSCTIKNKIGENKTEGKLRVKTPTDANEPVVINQLAETISVRYSPATFEAKILGNPKPEIVWKKDGKDLAESERIHLTEAPEQFIYRLTVENTNVPDMGKYSIHASNGHGKISSEASLDVRVPPEIIPPMDRQIMPKGKTSFEVTVTGRPQPVVTWCRNGKTLPQGAKFSWTADDKNSKYVLTVDGADLEDAGEYDVVGENVVTKAKANFNLLITTNDPKFTKVIDSTEVKPMKMAQFDCAVDGIPIPGVKWFRNGIELSPNYRINFVQHDERTHSLKIDEFCAEDVGDYECQAVSEVGVASCKARLDVLHTMPFFPKHVPKETCAIDGESFTLEAKVDGSPHPSVKWLKDGKPLEPSDRVKMVVLPDGTCKVTIDNAKASDCGKYTLVATNDTGELSSTGVVTVEAVPKGPTITEKLKKTLVHEGSPLQLTAKVTGYPKPSIKWFKDGKPVRLDHCYLADKQDGCVALVVDEAKPEDAGKYTLQIKNNLGETSSEAEVIVQSPPCAPFFPIKLRHMDVYDGYPIRLEGKVGGYPLPALKWLKDGKELKPDGQRIIASLQPDGILCLTVNDVKPEDSGKYTCVATNAEGEATSFSDVAVKSRTKAGEPIVAPSFITPLRDTVLEENLPLRLQAHIAGNPIPEVAWSKEGKPLKTTDGMLIVFDGDRVSLDIKKVNVGDAGKYECTLTNKEGVATSVSDVKIKKTSRAPVFTQRFPDLTVILAQDARFVCRATGLPNPDVTWYHNDKPLAESDKYKMKHEGDMFALYVRDCTLKDIGNITCKAYNIDGEEKCIAFLNVVDKLEKKEKTEAPSFLKKLADCEVIEGMGGKFTACVSGYPEPEFKWYKDGRELIPSDKVKFEVDAHGLLRLILKKVTPQDCGRYKLRITNPHGEAECEATLRCEDHERKPKKPMADLNVDYEKIKRSGVPFALPDKPIISKMTDRRLTLSWKPSIPVGPRVPVTYIVEMCECPDGDWFNVRTGVRSCCCEIHNLEPFRDYKFRIRVENKYGVSDPSPFATAYRTKLEMTPPKYLPTLPSELDFRPETSQYFPKDYDPDKSAHEAYAHAPRFLRQAYDAQYGVKNQPSNVQWFVYGYPMPTITWYFGEEKIEMGGRYDSSFARNAQATLYINRMLERDVGIYECVAINEHGEARQRVQVEIAEAPVFSMQLEETTVLLRDKCILQCRVVGTPYPEIKWYKDWHPLADSSRTKIEWKEPDLCTLTINDTITKDAGLYSCAARNIAGMSSNSVMVTIEENEGDYSILTYNRNRVVKARHKPFEDMYDIGDELGRGTQGIIYHAVERSTGNSLAAKIMHGKGELREAMDRELDIMNQMHSRHLIRAIDGFDTKKGLTLITELAAGGELLDSLCKQSTLKESDIAMYMRQVLWGLEHMHNKGIAHLGLTPGDLLLSKPGGDDIKICDFGLARRLIKGQDYYLDYGMPEFVAPEVANRKPISFHTDMWSVGVITYLMLSGISPFLGDHDRQTLQQVQQGKINFDPEVFKHISAEAKDFMSKLLVFDPSGRLDVKSALKHPWLKWADRPGAGEAYSTESLKSYYRRYREWCSNSACKRFYRRRPLESAFTHPSRMVYPPDEQYTPASSPEPSPGLRTKGLPTFKDKVDREHENYELGFADSESRYQAGPDTYLLQLRDVGFPLRLREYMRVGATRSPMLGFRLMDTMLGKAVTVRERRRFTDIMDEEIDEEKKGISDSTQRRITSEVAPRSETKNRIKELMPYKADDGQQPFFREKLHDQAIVEDQQTELSCFIIGDPKPVVQWYRNDVILSETHRIKFLETPEGRTVLRFAPSRSIDAGIYKVVARNASGEACCKARLRLGDVPGRTDAPEVSKVSDTEALLKWNQPKDTGNSHIGCYELECREAVEGSQWTLVCSCIDHDFFVVRNLKPMKPYQFRIRAQNKFGFGEFSSPSASTRTREDGVEKINVSIAMKHLQEITEAGRTIDYTVTEQQTPKNYSVEKEPLAITQGAATDKYSFVAEIARGQFSVIVKANKTEGDVRCAAKIMDASNADARAQQETETMRGLCHERLPVLLEAFHHNNLYILVMEKLQGYNVLTFLTQRHEYSEDIVARMVSQVLDALQYLHLRRTVHLDLQPDNIVVSNLQNGDFKLVDLGSAHKVGRSCSVLLDIKPGLLDYRAPEVINSEEVTVQADLWSLGVLTYILLSGVSPFVGNDDKETCENISYARYRFENLYKEVTSEATRFIMLLFKKTPAKRPTADECLECVKWFNPSDVMLKKRERAIFLSNRLKPYADEYHRKRSQRPSSAENLLSSFGEKFGRSASIECDTPTTF